MLSSNFPIRILTRQNYEKIMHDTGIEGVTIRIGLQSIVNKNNELLSQKAIYFVPGVEYAEQGSLILDGLDYGKICTTPSSSHQVYSIMRFLNRLHWGGSLAFSHYVKTISLPFPIVLDVAYYQKGYVRINIVDIEALRIDRNWYYGIKPVSLESKAPIIYPLPKRVRATIVNFGRWYRSTLKYYLNGMLRDSEHYHAELMQIYEDFNEDRHRIEKKEKGLLVREEERKEFVEDYKKQKWIEALRNDIIPKNDFLPMKNIKVRKEK